jgi:hypothetical protein
MVDKLADLTLTPDNVDKAAQGRGGRVRSRPDALQRVIRGPLV